MNVAEIGLDGEQLECISNVLRSHPSVDKAIIFGSRAKGNHRLNSDIDIALTGKIGELEAEAVANELEYLSVPYMFDILVYSRINNQALKEHIDKFGIAIYEHEIL